jgi:ubiquinone/menaquinone biosynthesis C-methylase UbiE
MMATTANRDTKAGAAVYTKTALKLYDFWVHGFSNNYLWHCPTEQLHALYQRHTSANHLEVGAGTGFFLKQVPFRMLKPRIVLMDLNPNTLETASRAIHHYQPAGVLNDILAQQQPSLPGFDSIAFNYVWHCLPADANKAQAFTHLSRLLNENGVLFGATLLGRGVPLNPLAKAVMKLYNQKGIFGNHADDRAALEAALAANFSRYDIRQEGAAALFTAWK